jgi:hypothetical protein
MIGKLKLRIVVPVGGVSEIVRLREEFPLPPPQFTVQGVFNPLQEASEAAAIRATNS